MNPPTHNPIEEKLAAQLEQAQRDMEVFRAFKEAEARFRELEARLAAEPVETKRPLSASELVEIAQNAPPQAGPARRSSSGASSFGEVDSVVRNIVASLTVEKFSIRDVVGELAEKGFELNPSSVRSVLRRMAKDKEILEEVRGQGRRPSIYLKLLPNADQGERRHETSSVNANGEGDGR